MSILPDNRDTDGKMSESVLLLQGEVDTEYRVEVDLDDE